MKILHLISSGGLYGAETMVVALSKWLQDTGHTSLIGVFHNLHSPNTQIADHAHKFGVPVEMIPCRGRIDPKAVLTLRRMIRGESFDTIHAHGYKADVYGYVANMGLGKPIFSTCHTWYDNDVSAYLYGIVDRKVLRRFDMTIAVSEAVASELRQAGVPERRITIVNNGVDLSAFDCRKPTLREELKTDKTIIGMVGRLAPEKGIEYLLRAGAIVLQKRSDVMLVIVGDGPDRKQLEALAQELGIQDSVVFTGARRDMPEVYASFDIQALPSVKEGLPMTLLESLASSKPVVATRVGAVAKVVVHEKTGLLIEPGDPALLANALLRLLEDAALRRQLGQAGRAWVQEHFSAEAMAKTYLELYQSVPRTDNGQSRN